MISGKNYKALKTASKVAVAKISDTEYTVTKKNYDANTGAALSDTIEVVSPTTVDFLIADCASQITDVTATKEDYEQLKADMEAL